MIKLHATVGKKVPIPDRDYSSQSYSAGIELEVADAATPEQLQERIQEVYRLLEATVDAEIQAGVSVVAPPVSQAQPVNRVPQDHGENGDHAPGNGKNRNGRATAAQVKAVFAIGKALGLAREELLGLVQAECGADKVEDLTLRQA